MAHKGRGRKLRGKIVKKNQGKPKAPAAQIRFSQDLFDTICERIGAGESLRAISEEDGMPDRGSVMRWIKADETGALRSQYARAREEQGDAHFDRVAQIVDKVEKRQLDPQQARVMFDALRWTAGKLRPKVYGEKLDLTHGNPDGSAIQPTIDASKLSTDALSQLLAARNNDA